MRHERADPRAARTARGRHEAAAAARDARGAGGGLQLHDPRRHIPVAELAEWVADESRCCPAVDFHVELPAFGALTLRIDGGADVKQFIAAELGL
ncbi:MAG TPA: hypothetical protein VHK90_06710 [Thermoanaerobaculia bacterium]|nr:hypothetical protein [Thermoanaerobaculia bacterium]